MLDPVSHRRRRSSNINLVATSDLLCRSFKRSLRLRSSRPLALPRNHNVWQCAVPEHACRRSCTDGIPTTFAFLRHRIGRLDFTFSWSSRSSLWSWWRFKPLRADRRWNLSRTVCPCWRCHCCKFSDICSMIPSADEDVNANSSQPFRDALSPAIIMKQDRLA